jgi:hypothetical protein
VTTTTEDGRELVSTLQAFGVVCRDEGRFDEGEAAFMRAIFLAETSPEPDPLVLAGLFLDLGRLEVARGRPGPGITWARGALAILDDATTVPKEV